MNDLLGKGIRGLECCSTYDDYSRKSCKECPYNEPDGKRSCKLHQMRVDALSILKAQEPRVMTLEEVKSIPYDADIWIETEYYVGKITIFAATINTKGLRGVMVYGSHKTYDYEAYNKLWR